MLPQYEDWEMNCLKTLDDLSALRQWLERHDAPQRILDIRERLKKQILIAQAMLPPPDDDTNDDQDVTLDDYDTAILDDLSETYGGAVSAVRRPVNPPPAPTTTKNFKVLYQKFVWEFDLVGFLDYLIIIELTRL